MQRKCTIRRWLVSYSTLARSGRPRPHFKPLRTPSTRAAVSNSLARSAVDRCLLAAAAAMAVMLQFPLGDVVVDLYDEGEPARICESFTRLCSRRVP